jgi:GNAT superfamily N-acetyltransferase
MNLEMRLLTDDDLAVAAVILDGAYGPGPSRVDRLRRYLAIEPEGWYLALVDGEPVGLGGALDFGAYSYVGLVGVLPEKQRLGLGRAIMSHLLAWLERITCPTVLLDASDAGIPLYLRLGFVETDKVHVFTGGKARPGSAPGARIAPYSERDFEDVVALDGLIAGGDRRKLLTVYLAAFASRAFVARDEHGRISGFVIAQSLSIGPWIATDETAAAGLLDGALALDFAEPPVLASPAANTAAEQVIVERGFARARTLAHMRLGEEPARRRDLIYGQASLAAG